MYRSPDTGLSEEPPQQELQVGLTCPPGTAPPTPPVPLRGAAPAGAVPLAGGSDPVPHVPLARHRAVRGAAPAGAAGGSDLSPMCRSPGTARSEEPLQQELQVGLTCLLCTAPPKPDCRRNLQMCL